MTSTNDGKDVKSNQTSGPKGKTYYIELYKVSFILIIIKISVQNQTPLCWWSSQWPPYLSSLNSCFRIFRCSVPYFWWNTQCSARRIYSLQYSSRNMAMKWLVFIDVSSVCIVKNWKLILMVLAIISWNKW